MILGNPYKFAVLSGAINEWNLDDVFSNGVLPEAMFHIPLHPYRF